MTNIFFCLFIKGPKPSLILQARLSEKPFLFAIVVAMRVARDLNERRWFSSTLQQEWHSHYTDKAQQMPLKTLSHRNSVNNDFNFRHMEQKQNHINKPIQ